MRGNKNFPSLFLVSLFSVMVVGQAFSSAGADGTGGRKASRQKKLGQ
jgi:hypothetical protein